MIRLSHEKYIEIVQALNNMKIVHGPEWLNATLTRHHILRNALLDYEKCYIIDLESELIRED